MLLHTHSFNKYLVSTYCVLAIILGAGDTAVNKNDQNPYPHGADILVKGDSESANKWVVIRAMKKNKAGQKG